MANLNPDLRAHLKLLRTKFQHAKQIPLLPRPAKPTSREKRQYVAEKLHGFELRQAERDKKRFQKRKGQQLPEPQRRA
jgi:hypothetical protein